ncbi:TIGR01777 family oxidoreductase [Engelhardtia mirabilis]|uniref:Epimerase family protein n=1 Tax=Engelhardtia mirabilis TaxID=2528011 RepID=A0A518BQ76_9BACT|nr:Epimerase family protein [Planctomycetes bacterium Pla133]QDV03450.1 Epimerase family protein [Planctomycetes bacterium Pla86]
MNSTGAPVSGHPDAPAGAVSFERAVDLPVSREEAFAWHDRPGAFERLTPPFDPAEVIERRGEGICDGTTVELRVGKPPLRLKMVAQHSGYDPPRGFVDSQLSGPFAHWRHEHRFEERGANACRMVDSIRYLLPLAPVGPLFGGSLVRSKLRRMFDYRHATTAADLADHARARALLEPRGQWPLRVLVSGASGLVGSALCAFLTTGGHSVHRLVRRAARTDDEVRWDPAAGEVDPESVSGYDVVVHLAGAGIADKRWSDERKRLILDSRVDGTRALAGALAAAPRPPRVMLSTSAVGFYGDRGEETLDESSAAGTGFLADVAREWEAAADPAREAGVRVIHPRLGVVLSPAGGALGKLLLPFQLGLGGPLGSGSHYMPWIGIDDVLGAMLFCIADEQQVGPINFCAPQDLTNLEFSRTLGRVLSRPALLPVPPPALRVVLGDMVDEALMASTRVVPKRLNGSGYRFRHSELESALRHVLGRT